jgi:transposase InsO family protein
MTYTVLGFSGATVRLQDSDGAVSLIVLTELQAPADFALLKAADPATTQPVGLLATVPPEALERARWWEQHLLDVEPGLSRLSIADQHPDTPDPATEQGGATVGSTTVASTTAASTASGSAAGTAVAITAILQREAAKVAELRRAGIRCSARTLQRYRAAYAAQGLWGLVDQRGLRPSLPTGRSDPRVVDAVLTALAEQLHQSTGTKGRVIWRVDNLLRQRYGPDTVGMPARSTMYRLIDALEGGRHSFGSATTRRSLAQRPSGRFGSLQAVRPGQYTEIDSTRLDVMALRDDGQACRVELTGLIDLATRTLCTAVIAPESTKGVDAALILARGLVPERLRPGWPAAASLQRSSLPHEQLAAVDDRLNTAAAKPVIMPESVTVDHGKAFLSETFQSACAHLGISLQPAHPGEPTDKPHIERTILSINTLFCQYVAGYTGRDTTRRARTVAEQATWSIKELQELFDQWVVLGWQSRPHNGLRHPELPTQPLSPNEMYAALVASCGHLPLSLKAADYLELLPVKWRRIDGRGIRLASLTYHCDGGQLRPLYRRSPYAHRQYRWPVHYDPHNLGQVWVRLPEHGDPSTPPTAPETVSPPPAIYGPSALPSRPELPGPPHRRALSELSEATGQTIPDDDDDDDGREQRPSDAAPTSTAPPGWLEVPWVHRDRVAAPFADLTLQHVRKIIAARGDRSNDQNAVAEALRALLQQAFNAPVSRPDHCRTAAVASRTRAVAADRATPFPSTPGAPDAPLTTPKESTAVTCPPITADPHIDVEVEVDLEVDVEVDDDVEPFTDPSSGTDANDAPLRGFGLFDAHQAAQRPW